MAVAFNHDIVDGAPPARFVNKFKELVGTGALLDGLADPTARLPLALPNLQSSIFNEIGPCRRRYAALDGRHGF